MTFEYFDSVTHDTSKSKTKYYLRKWIKREINQTSLLARSAVTGGNNPGVESNDPLLRLLIEPTDYGTQPVPGMLILVVRVLFIETLDLIRGKNPWSVV